MHTNNIFHAGDIAQLKQQREAIAAVVHTWGFALIRDLVNRDDVRARLGKIFTHINQAPRLPSSGVNKKQIRQNCVKWSIGSHSQSQSGIARLMLTVMNPMQEDDLFGLRETFAKLIMTRDTLAGLDHYLFDENLPAPKFNGTRLQVYPTGGGFMTRHIDTRAIDNAKDVSRQYIQLVLLLTEKGADYANGGAFVEKNGVVMDSETGARSGDILVYDGNTMHGVADIDSHKPFDPSNAGGRIVALATVYD